MDPKQFDRISKLFAARRLSRRAALAAGGTAFAAGLTTTRVTSAQEASPEATPISDTTEERHSQTLFLQAFQSGSIAPKTDAEGHYVVTLDHGLGQTVYFTDRPERIVGVTPTAKFLADFGLSEGDPPNAALVVEKADGTTEIAVVELIDPKYDDATDTATYEVAVLKEFERELGVGFEETPADLATFGPEFGAAHLFIDDCAGGTVTCSTSSTDDGAEITLNAGFCYVNACCQPCTDGSDPHTYWANQCQASQPSACLFCDSDGNCYDNGANQCAVIAWSSWLIPCVE